MRCCICGKEILNYGNNPFPLCEVEDFNSRCCDECNDLVLQARLAMLKKTDDVLDVNDTIIIFYSKNSEEPIKFLYDTKQFLGGVVEEVVHKDNKVLYKGTWGRFYIDNEADQFIRI